MFQPLIRINTYKTITCIEYAEKIPVIYEQIKPDDQ